MARKAKNTASNNAPVLEIIDDAILQAAIETLGAAEAEQIAKDFDVVLANEAVDLTEAEADAVLLSEAIDDAMIEETADETSEEAAEPTFDEIRANLDPERVETTVFRAVAELDDRADFETDKNPDNTNIHKTLKKVRAQLASKRAAEVMLVANVSPGFINRSENTGSRYNVYALGKAGDIIAGATEGTISNAINLACMRSLFKCAKAGVPFTMEVAKAAASDKIRIDAAIRQHLVRHTVSASTAPTQASSTMQALETLGVVRAEGSKKNPTFVLTNNPIVAHLEAKLAA